MPGDNAYLEPGTLVENSVELTGTSGRHFASGELRGAVLTCYRVGNLAEYRCRLLTETGEMEVCSTKDLRVVPCTDPTPEE